MGGIVDNLKIESLLQTHAVDYGAETTIASTNGSLALSAASAIAQVIDGNATGFSVTLPNATTLGIMRNFIIFNNSEQTIVINSFGGSPLLTVSQKSFVFVYLKDNATAAGEWITSINAFSGSDTEADFTTTNAGFEDFMFDAYGGNGGNDNQYAFTAIANNGSSDIDGAIDVVGNNYEGIHILNSLAVATSRPLVDAFGGVNRIRLGAQKESYEVRVRIETQSTTANAFTARFGLMSANTAGIPANGVFFSYNPVNQVFAVAQVVSVSWTRVNNFTYTVTINGTPCSYTSDATATDAEIAAGLVNAINAASLGVTATGATKPITITANVAGVPFTYSVGTNLTATLTTANVVPVAYDGRWSASVVNSSVETRLQSNVQVEINKWFRLRASVNAAGNSTLIYINDVFIGEIAVAVPTAAMRFVFKLEKTTGTSQAICSIDYIAWKRTRL